MAVTVTIDEEDPSVQYVGRWAYIDSSVDNFHGVRRTLDVGAQAIFKFKGSAVSVFGILQQGAAATPTVSFSMDGSGATIFRGEPLDSENLHRQQFYTSSGLDQSKEHILVITVVNITGNPFYLDYFQIVQAEVGKSHSDLPSTSSAPASSDMRSLFPTTVMTQQSSSFTQPLPSLIAASTTISPSMQTPGTSESFSPSSNVIPVPSATTTAATQSQSSTNSTQKPNTKIIGIAVGIAVCGLLLLTVLIVLCRLHRNNKKDKTNVLSVRSSGQVTAYPTASPMMPTSQSFFGGCESGAGYIVRGGLSKEKTAGGLSSDGHDTNGRRSSNSEPPAYESEFGDTIPPRQLLG